MIQGVMHRIPVQIHYSGLIIIVHSIIKLYSVFSPNLCDCIHMYRTHRHISIPDYSLFPSGPLSSLKIFIFISIGSSSPAFRMLNGYIGIESWHSEFKCQGKFSICYGFRAPLSGSNCLCHILGCLKLQSLNHFVSSYVRGLCIHVETYLF